MKMRKSKILFLFAGAALLGSCVSVSETVPETIEARDIAINAASSGASTADEVSPTDLNIYIYSSAARSQRTKVWGWSDDNSALKGLFPVSSASNVVFNELDPTMEFIPIYLSFDKEYACESAWSGGVSTTFKISLENCFTGLVIRDDTGSSKSKDIVFDVSKAKEDSSGHRNIYVYENKKVYYSLSDFPVTPVESGDYMEKLDPSNKRTRYPRISLTAKAGKSMGEILTSDILSRGLEVRAYRYDDDNNRVYASSASRNADTSASYINDSGEFVFSFDGKNAPLDLSYHYEIDYYPEDGKKSVLVDEVSMLSYYSSNAFDETYHTNMLLGANVVDGKTVFSVWSPTASSVTLCLYDNATDRWPTHRYNLSNGVNGTFYIAFEGSMHGTYYDFRIDNFGVVDDNVPDPYAQSSNANGERSMVVDWELLGRSNADSLWAPKVDGNYSGVTIMEMHTRDFTSSPSWNGKAENKGKFLGLIEEGTSLSDGTKTGFDYVKGLKEKGLTHVQILPAFDAGSVDETLLEDEEYCALPYGGNYNWGYDPEQYNAPEGAYSSDPNDGLTRVNEFKSFVDAYNDAGIGVIMDVVYNHMPSQTGTSFERVFPGYYFRTDSSSGAGVDLASQRGMVREFIVDSVLGWATHYHISGFRFDLMGLLDLATMRYIRQKLDEIDPNILIYGEGWSMFGGDRDYGTRFSDMATQGNIAKMGEDWVGAFNDVYRDGVNGQNTNPSAYGYAQKALRGGDITQEDADKMYYGLSGTNWRGSLSNGTYSPASSDGQGASIAYLECHDNMTLWDKLTISRQTDSVDIEKEVSMSNASLLGALSPAFFQIGQDFGRSKKITDEKYLVADKYYADPLTSGVYYSHDSYNLSDDINGIDWNLLKTHSSVKSSFDEALEARKSRASALGKTYSCVEFYEENGGAFQTNLASDNHVISYSLRLSSGQTYVYAQNWTSSSVSIGSTGLTADPYEVVSEII